MSTNKAVYQTLNKIKQQLNKVHQPDDPNMKKHIDGLYEVCDLLQDLIEVKDVAKATEPK